MPSCITCWNRHGLRRGRPDDPVSPAFGRPRPGAPVVADLPGADGGRRLLHDADEIPVGEDQSQHLELARDVADPDTRYGRTFTVPRAVHPGGGVQGDGSADPLGKMGKSNATDTGLIYSLDPPETVRRKVAGPSPMSTGRWPTTPTASQECRTCCRSWLPANGTEPDVTALPFLLVRAARRGRSTGQVELLRRSRNAIGNWSRTRPTCVRCATTARSAAGPSRPRRCTGRNTPSASRLIDSTRDGPGRVAASPTLASGRAHHQRHHTMTARGDHVDAEQTHAVCCAGVSGGLEPPAVRQGTAGTGPGRLRPAAAHRRRAGRRPST